MATWSWSRADAAPVRGTRSPTLMGPLCAAAEPGAPPAITMTSSAIHGRRRESIGIPPSAPRAAKGTHDAVRREQDDADVHGAQDEQPALRVDAHEVFEEHDHTRAEHGADERARPAQRRHEERLHRSDELHVGGSHEAVVV